MYPLGQKGKNNSVLLFLISMCFFALSYILSIGTSFLMFLFLLNLPVLIILPIAYFSKRYMGTFSAVVISLAIFTYSFVGSGNMYLGNPLAPLAPFILMLAYLLLLISVLIAMKKAPKSKEISKQRMISLGINILLFAGVFASVFFILKVSCAQYLQLSSIYFFPILLTLAFAILCPVMVVLSNNCPQFTHDENILNLALSMLAWGIFAYILIMITAGIGAPACSGPCIAFFPLGFFIYSSSILPTGTALLTTHYACKRVKNNE